MKYFSCMFAFILAFNFCQAQDLRFTYDVTNSGNTSSIVISVYNISPTPENMAGYTVNLYYDNAESTLTGFDASATSVLGWTITQSSTLHVASSNSTVPISHSGFGTINVIDELVAGNNFGTTPVEILTINFDNTTGTPAPSTFYVASTANNHPALNYVGSDFVGHPVITQPNNSLPVELLDFEVQALENRTTALTWETNSELNNKGFYIE